MQVEYQKTGIIVRPDYKDIFLLRFKLTYQEDYGIGKEKWWLRIHNDWWKLIQWDYIVVKYEDFQEKYEMNEEWIFKLSL